MVLVDTSWLGDGRRVISAWDTRLVDCPSVSRALKSARFFIEDLDLRYRVVLHRNRGLSVGDCRWEIVVGRGVGRRSGDSALIMRVSSVPDRFGQSSPGWTSFL